MNKPIIGKFITFGLTMKMVYFSPVFFAHGLLLFTYMLTDTNYVNIALSTKYVPLYSHFLNNMIKPQRRRGRRERNKRAGHSILPLSALNGIIATLDYLEF